MQPSTRTRNLTPDHIGIVVEDAENVAKLFSSLLGIGPWYAGEYAPSANEMIVGEPFRLKEAWARFGSLPVELQQPVDGKGPWAKYLETTGGGLYHIAFNVANYDEVVASLEKGGAEIIVSAETEGIRWAYFDIKGLGFAIELMDNCYYWKEDECEVLKV